jgi:hypothetical protein
MQNPNDLSITTILALAQAKIRDPAHWCAGSNATDAAGKGVPYDSPLAERWCAAGALASVMGRAARSSACFRPMIARLDQAAQCLTHVYGVVRVNDFLGHATVMRVFDLAVDECFATT